MRTSVGQYRIENLLGRGGMGVVYRGVHENLGRPVAIKVLPPELTAQPEFKERFFSEAKTQARLQHPNIVSVYDLLEDAGEYFIVMELVDGVGLDERMQAGQPMEVEESVHVFAQILAALDHAHSLGVIHRDIKPANVMITAEGQVKLTDFGIALLVGDKRMTASQSTIGTPVYMSPEQILRPRSVDHRTDLYSAAVVFYEMLAGRPPFDADTEYGIKKLHVEAPPPDIMALHAGLPSSIALALVTALSKEPDDRFASAGLFLGALQEAVPAGDSGEGQPLPSAPARLTRLDSVPKAPPPPPAPAGTVGELKTRLLSRLEGVDHRVMIAAAAVVLVLGLGSVVLLVASGGSGPEATNEVASNTEDEPGPILLTPRSEELELEQEQEQDVEVVAIRDLPTQAPPTDDRWERATRAAPPPQPRQPRRAVVPEPTAVVNEPARPAPVQPQPVQIAAEPVASRTEPSEETVDVGLDEFQQMEDLIVNLERLSSQAVKAYEDEGREDQLLDRLESFSDIASKLRKEFRKATGTGFRGLGRKILHRGGQDAANRALEITFGDLQRRGGEITSLVRSSAPGAVTRQYWQEIESRLDELERYFD